jgi:hypothetical protein
VMDGLGLSRHSNAPVTRMSDRTPTRASRGSGRSPPAIRSTIGRSRSSPVPWDGPGRAGGWS